MMTDGTPPNSSALNLSTFVFFETRATEIVL